MRKDILAKAIRIADKSTIRPEKAVVVSPKSVKHTLEILSHRLYTRITPTEFRRMQAVLGHGVQQWTLLRNLLVQYLDSKSRHPTSHDKKRKKK